MSAPDLAALCRLYLSESGAVVATMRRVSTTTYRMRLAVRRPRRRDPDTHDCVGCVLARVEEPLSLCGYCSVAVPLAGDHPPQCRCEACVRWERAADAALDAGIWVDDLRREGGAA